MLLSSSLSLLSVKLNGITNKLILTFSWLSGIFRDNSLFIGSNCRTAVNEGRADFVPIFLVEIPLLFRRNILNLDVALIQLSPPDKHGFCSLGPSVDCVRAAIQNAKHIIGLKSILSLSVQVCQVCPVNIFVPATVRRYGFVLIKN